MNQRKSNDAIAENLRAKKWLQEWLQLKSIAGSSLYLKLEHKKNVIKKIRVVTNRWDISAEEVSEIYRYRWQIEMFFKWLKQHANLKKWYNTKPEAVGVQVYLSLITHALCELIRLTMKPEISCWEWLQQLNFRLSASPALKHPRLFVL